MAQLAFVRDELRSGQLVSPLPLRVPTERGYFLTSHPNRPKLKQVQAFEDWIENEINSINSVTATEPL